MSGGDRNRKKAPRAQGWEEAGAEFYQESYPSTDTDFDVLQRDPNQLTTLLPSKQTRAAATTIKRIRTTTDTKTFRRQTSSRSRRGSTTTRRASTTADVQVSMLPDLSENLSNEQRTWEEIMQIKALPISMAQKKEMKAKLQSEPNLRLQGFEQLKWKRRKIWKKFQTQIKESYSKLELWRNDLKKIEGNCGTGVVAYFLFIKWLLFLNFGIFTLVFLFVILPSIIFKDVAQCDDCCSSIYFNQTTDSNIVLDLVQGTGQMERTILFYGIYSNETFSYEINGTKLYYDLPLAYIAVTIVYFLLSLFAIVKSAAKGFKERLVEGEGQFYQYCNLIFGGWDFCIHNDKTANMKHKAIFNEIKGLLEIERREEERQNRTQQERTKLVIVRVFINIVVVAVLAASAAAIYFVFDYSTEKVKNFPKDSIFNSSIESLLYEFLPSLSIVFLNIIVPLIFSFLVDLEKYSPINVIRITLVRTVFLRLSSLFVLYASLYIKVSCDSENVSSCVSLDCTLCWESFVGQQIYKLVLTDFATHTLLTFFINFPRALIAKNCNNKVAKIIGAQDFELPKHVLDVIYSQTLCWLGCFYSPLLPAIATIICFLMFYIKKFSCLINSTPSVTIYRASRSNSMFMIVLLLSYVFAVIPIAYGIGELLPSESCGPFRALPSVWSYIVNVFSSSPTWLQSILFFIGTAGFAVPAFVVLTLLLYYYWAVNSANRHMVVVLKNQLVLEGHDKQFLLDRLSMFIKQQQESQKRLRHAEMMRDGERIVSSN
ncbi:hypothetical protein RN001_015209 [Aquatica leii]|uniref:TMC domain-containing protein n=1 Tax=Aquatica leii TaxID=1421715 RepID=A0AAN7SNF6_9COLE|nr:hypothetical protein RN001_015209 [Aquatica leii]